MHDPNLTSMGAVQEILDILTPLLGVWTGRGKGVFPTLDAFDYFETFRVQRDPGAAYFTYEQNTELIDPEGRSIRKSHWEAGVLRPLDDGSLELACVQGSGRVEILRGEFLSKETLAETIALRFQSELIGNDERVKSTSREWSLNGNHLKYFMKMATSRVEELSLHLEANLFKL
jgi:hypothetical protein